MHAVTGWVVDESGKMDLVFVLLLLTSVCSSGLAGLDSQGSVCCSNLFGVNL